MDERKEQLYTMIFSTLYLKKLEPMRLLTILMKLRYSIDEVIEALSAVVTLGFVNVVNDSEDTKYYSLQNAKEWIKAHKDETFKAWCILKGADLATYHHNARGEYFLLVD